MESRMYVADFKKFCQKCCVHEGMSSDHAWITAEVLCETDLFGIHSHGAKNLYGYVKKKRAGGMNFTSEPMLLREGPSYALLDAKDGIGMVAGWHAMRLAILKAKEAGISLVSVRNSTHFGAAGYYANMAATEGMFGIAMSNVDPNMTVPGAKNKIIGNNPLSFASPLSNGKSIFLDIAMSNVASLKVVQARKDGAKIPDNWIVDKNGLPTTSPDHYPEEGAMQPMSAHKGYGLAVMIELLTGILSGGGIGSLQEIRSWCFESEARNNVSHTFLAVSPDHFDGASRYLSRSDAFVSALHNAPKASGKNRIFLPGEMEWETREKHQEIIELPDEVMISLNEMSELLGIPLNFLG